MALSNNRRASKGKANAKASTQGNSGGHKHRRRADESGDDAEITKSKSSKPQQKKAKTTHGAEDSDEDIEVLPSPKPLKKQSKKTKMTHDDEEDMEEDDESEGDKASDQDNDEGSGLEERHQAPVAKKLRVKGDSVRDVLTIFTDRTTVKFSNEGKLETVKGRWCLICK